MMSWKELVKLSPEELSKRDIAAMNLACAEGLPGAENLDHAGLLDRLDYFARRVRQESAANYWRFRKRRYDYQNSEGYFLALALVTVLQQSCGVRYNPLKIDEDAVFDTADTFIFGILRDMGGTCATMPVVYVAVGRRLGYPMSLVAAFGGKATHLFARWDDGKVRFNIEATGEGMRCPTDAYYRTGRYSTTSEIERDGLFLQSKASQQELATFLNGRMCCLRSAGRHRAAVDAAAWSSALDPENRLMANTFRSTLYGWTNTLLERRPPGFPTLHFREDAPRRFPASIPLDEERDILGAEAMENLLNSRDLDRRFWQPLRRGIVPPELPKSVFVDFDEGRCNIRFRSRLYPKRRSAHV
jgi:Transglutaminase-like superfamily